MLGGKKRKHGPEDEWPHRDRLVETLLTDEAEHTHVLTSMLTGQKGEIEELSGKAAVRSRRIGAECLSRSNYDRFR